MDGKQLTLFGISEVGLDSKVSESNFSNWSYSRRKVLEQCARRYYYEYYGSILKKSNNDPQKEKLNFLKKLQNRYLRTGDILHFVVRWYLKKLQEGERILLDQLLRWAQEVYHRDINYSQQYKQGSPLFDDFRQPKLMQEYYYKLSDAQSLCSDAEKRLVSALKNFVKSQNIVQYREGAAHPSALIEVPAHMKNNYFFLRGKVDLVYWKNDKIIIVDWKTGGASSSDDSLQMLAYALWAKTEFELPPNSIILNLVYLADNTVSTFSVNEKKLLRVEARILQDLDRMQEVDSYGTRGIVEAFTPCAQQKVCDLCEYREVCPKE